MVRYVETRRERNKTFVRVTRPDRVKTYLKEKLGGEASRGTKGAGWCALGKEEANYWLCSFPGVRGGSMGGGGRAIQKADILQKWLCANHDRWGEKNNGLASGRLMWNGEHLNEKHFQNRGKRRQTASGR